MKIALVFPRTKYVSGDPPIGLAYIASYARNMDAGLDISIVDSTFAQSLGHVRDSLRRIRPDIVGIFVDTLMFDNAVTVAEYAKEAGAVVIMGGPHATVLPESLCDKCDIVVKGEGETAFFEIVKKASSEGLDRSAGTARLEAGKIIDHCDRRIQDLDSIPFPAFDLLDMNSYKAAWNYLDSVDIGLEGTTMITSRGCPYKCSYCQPTLDMLFGSKLRRRTPENVIAEIEHLKESFSIKGIFFHDDTFTIDKGWVMDFCTLMKRRDVPVLWGCNSRINTIDEEVLSKMFQAGLRNIHFGIEAGSQRVLDEVYNKKISLDSADSVISLSRKMGIHTLGFFMIGAPGETAEEIDMTIKLARKLPLDEATFSITTPLIGTYLYDKVKDSSGYELSDRFGDFDYHKGLSIRKGALPVRVLKYLQKKALLCFYLDTGRLRYILKHLLSVKGIKKLYRKVRRFI